MDEKATTIGEGQYEHASRPTPSMVCSSPSFFNIYIYIYIFFFFALYFPFAGFTKISFPDRGRDRFIFGLIFLRPDYFYPQSLVPRPNDSDVAIDRSTMIHFLSLDLLSFSTSQKDVFV